MLDEIAGEAILKIPLSSGSCALGGDDRFYLNWIGREKMTENHRLHQLDILGRGHDEFRNFLRSRSTGPKSDATDLYW